MTLPVSTNKKRQIAILILQCTLKIDSLLLTRISPVDIRCSGNGTIKAHRGEVAMARMSL